MLIIPAIDLRNGKCVRLSQGRKDAPIVYSDDPITVAKEFELAGAELLHIVDLDAAFSDGGSPNRDLLGQIIRAIEIPVQFGGGLRTAKDVEAILKLGVKRAIVGTLAVESPETVADLVREFGDSGSDRIAVGIDAKDGEVMVRGWEQRGRIRAAELACLVAQAGIERIIYTDVARDGMMSGPNIEQTRLLARESGLKVTASGGVSSLADLERLKQLESVGVDSVIVGKALYERRFTFAEAIKR
ncbi:MAG TPA: 1-(5-phosphoribosyl)-5-[(5-phosphoribosylamino)methylideneamino]imidazole-4-carboxamide isomerase [Pyrinomonadaceae bacterium]|jgi:phosphoribosylformimino-5-aminoimidazole carboxamide ribotide isomerase|nr:1-(5-phosphoribosyl)-5-[(5-phosphoribosylamino)methylideneamino]imidazole-4-carboxamide isomerase [Pyrinomonadaceae bacterium]